MGYILKFLILLLAVWVVISFVKKLASTGDQKENTSSDGQSEAMLQCSVCGVYAPHSKTSKASGKIICASCHEKE